MRTYIQDVSGAESRAWNLTGAVAEEGKAKREGNVPKNKDEQRACLSVTDYIVTTLA